MKVVDLATNEFLYVVEIPNCSEETTAPGAPYAAAYVKCLKDRRLIGRLAETVGKPYTDRTLADEKVQRSSS